VGWGGRFAGLAGLSPQLTGGSLRAAATVARAWIEQWDNHRAGLVSALGEQLVEERQADRRAELRAIENGVLSRSLFTAVRPGPSAQEPSRRPRPGLRTWDNLAAALSPDLRGLLLPPSRTPVTVVATPREFAQTSAHRTLPPFGAPHLVGWAGVYGARE
jgi:hypothetical protein